jgi:hypothetical protein
MLFIGHNIKWLKETTRIVVTFLAKYLRDYKNSHIFATKD